MLAARRGSLATANFASDPHRPYNSGRIRPNDTHVLALAIVSEARLLYSRDKMLREDFTNTQIIGEPVGRLYNNGVKDKLTTAHYKRLAQAHPCRESRA